MNPATASEPKSKPPGWLRRTVRGLGCIALGGVLLLLTVWAAAALHFDVRVSWLRTPLAIAYLLGVLVMWFVVKGRWRKVVLTAGGFALVLGWWLTLRPANDRDWQPDLAVLAHADIQGIKGS